MTGGPDRLHRRDWLRAAAVVAGMGRVGSGAPPGDAVEQIRARARAAGMQPLDRTESAHFVGIGDATAAYRAEALDLCEAFAADYFAHFRGKGFTLDWPAARLPVVILGSPQSFAAFEGGFGDEAAGGYYDLEANWLVTYDFRPAANQPRGLGAADPRLDNTLALAHETFHQLSYNTGMLDRGKPGIPLYLTEGLAAYAETWRPARKGAIGAINARRRRGLELGLKGGTAWIALPTLIAHDALQDDEKFAQVARAEGWMLVYKCLRDPARLPHFRDYIRAVQQAPDPLGRVALATTHLGDLARLDREIRR